MTEPKKRAPRKKAVPSVVPAAASGGPGAEELDRLVGGAHHDPHSILGMHPVDEGVVVRALRPDAEAVVALVDGQRIDLAHLQAGIWEARVPGGQVTDYRLEVTYHGSTYPADDPYRYLPTLGEVDLHLIDHPSSSMSMLVLMAISVLCACCANFLHITLTKTRSALRQKLGKNLSRVRLCARLE